MIRAHCSIIHIKSTPSERLSPVENTLASSWGGGGQSVIISLNQETPIFPVLWTSPQGPKALLAYHWEDKCPQ